MVFAPQAEGSPDSLALSAARQCIDESRQTLMRARFPMGASSDAVWTDAADRVAARLLNGDDVAFLTQGDPMLYGSFMYVMQKIKAARPQIPIEVVPGVSSIAAAAARAQIPIASHGERLAVIPAMYGIDDLRRALADYDAVALMKVNARAIEAVARLEAQGELSRCVFARRVSTPQERVAFTLRGVDPEDADYFSMLIISGSRKG